MTPAPRRTLTHRTARASTHSTIMVVGVIMDARRAASEGKSTLTVLTNGNLQVATHLSLSTRLLFWATNAPYWLLAAQLLHAPPPSSAWPRAHAASVAGVALISTLYHGAVLFGLSLKLPPRVFQALTARLLALDVVAANAYGVALVVFSGVARSAPRFAPPLTLLLVGARAKRTSRPVTFAWCHGLWHIFSAYVMFWTLYDEYLGV